MSELNRTKEVLEFIWVKFEFFLRRTILPSTTLFTLMIGIYINHYGNLLDNEVLVSLQKEPWVILIFLFFIIILSTNYLLKILAQLFFDNFMKINYDTNFMYKEESRAFVKFRKKVLLKLAKDTKVNFDTTNISDFELYQVLGRVLSSYEKGTYTKRYATDAKEAGITIVSILISLLYYIFLEGDMLSLVFIIPLYSIGFQYIKSKYRSRAYRMYANYLVGEI